MKKILASIFTCLFIAGCSGVHGTVEVGAGRSASVKTRVDAPFKSVPKKDRIPGTQKPYRINGRTYYPLPTARGYVETGIASWYGSKFHGRKTSNGETYNMWGTTAAHKTLPMNTYLLVKNLANGKEMTVRVNDRGPFSKGRIIDMTKTGASKLGFVEQGTTKVRITALAESTTYKHGEVVTERFKEYPDFQTGDFYVQIGAFTDHNNARRLKDRMLDWGRKAVIVKFDRGDMIFFRVQVRAGSSLTAAERVEKALSNSGFPGAFVVAR
jgi:rare lipoprotein A